MNWYKRLKQSQVVNYQSLVNSIYQRLMQAADGSSAAESTVDDVMSQGFDAATIEAALLQAIQGLLGPQGTETQLNDGQRHIIQMLRGVQPMEMPDETMQPNNPVEEQMGHV